MHQDLFNAVDSMDSAAFAQFLTEDCYFRFANLPAVVGKSHIESFVGQFFDSLGGITHELEQYWKNSDALICHGHVTYTRKDRSVLRVPFSTIFKLRGQQVCEYLIFVDNSKLDRTQ